MTRNIYKLGAIDAHKSVFLLCDLQEGFRTQVKLFPEVVKIANKMVEAAKALKIPLYISEQYPKGFGSTVEEIDTKSARLVYPKTCFNMYTPELQERLKEDVPDLKSVVLFGLAAHVCIEQSVIDFLCKDIMVHVLADGVSARSLIDRELALQRLQSIGCFVGTSENVLYKLLKDKNNPAFNVISKLNRTPIPDKFGEPVEDNLLRL